MINQARTLLDTLFQVEAHVYLNQKPMIDLCRQYGIVLTAYGPLGRPGLSQDPVNDPTLLDDPQIKGVAAKYGRTVAQILLRYLVSVNTASLGQTLKVYFPP